MILSLSHYYRLCKYRHILSSLYFNIHYFGWKDGLKLPVTFFSPIKLRDMKGRVVIKASIKSGLIAIGLPGNEMFDYKTPCIWSNQGGTVVFKGSFGTNPGMSFVIRKDARLIIGEHTSFGQNLRVLCSKEISLGDEILGSWDVTIMDTDSHYFENNGIKSEFSKPIFIGNHCFIGNGVSIQKGSVIPEKAVIAAKSVVTGVLQNAESLYAGIPARLVKQGIQYLK